MSGPSSETALHGVLLRRRGPVHEIVLNEPSRRNPMSPAIMRGLEAACDAICADPDCRVAVLTGAGSAFCAGGDLRYNDAHLGKGPVEDHRFLTSLYQPFLRVLDLPVPTIAAINGAAVGGGLALALLCDIRVAACEAELRTAFSTIGFAPGLGLTYSLAFHVGLARAAELLYTGGSVSGEEAEAMGLVNQAVPRDRLRPVVAELADAIAAGSPLVNRLAKALLTGPYRSALRERLSREIMAQVTTASDEEYRSRRQAVAQGRRKP